MKPKVWCSCIRSNLIREFSTFEATLLETNKSPQEGDLVLVKVVTTQGAYTEVENAYGRNVQLYIDDIFVGVLGTRESGTKLTGKVPSKPIKRGDLLNLIANGGLVAQATCVPTYYHSQAMIVEVQGFLRKPNGHLANLRDFQQVGYSSVQETIERNKFIFVGGTSAESGKTTFVCSAIRSIKKLFPETTVSAIKAAGTGRLRDLLRYVDAGADHVSDFVDAGWPSTYNISPNEYLQVLKSLIKVSQQHTELAFIEIGGDLLGACAPYALNIASELDTPIVLLANDAMGASAGISILESKGFSSITVSTLRQNPEAMANRLGLSLSSVLDPLNEDHIDHFIHGLFISKLI